MTVGARIPQGAERVRPQRGPAGPDPLLQLFLMRLRALAREPAAVFWVFAFPLLISIALGLAFRNRALDELAVAVADGPEADALAARLDRVDGLTARRATAAEAQDALRRGRVALAVVPGPEPELLVDPTQPDGRTARLLVLDSIERMRGREDRVRVNETRITAPGSRYIDFLIPGLLGMGLMSSGVWGLGWAIVQMRTGRLLKRLVASPMRRSHFLLSFVGARVVLGVAEVAFFLVFARLLFDVRVFGSVATLFAFGLLGAMSFGGVSLLIASRAQTNETAAGLMNAVTMPMMVLSGVFFSASHFPAWMQPLIRVLPLTALNDGLRAIMIDGAAPAAVATEAAILVGWGGAAFAVALRIFRWST